MKHSFNTAIAVIIAIFMMASCGNNNPPKEKEVAVTETAVVPSKTGHTKTDFTFAKSIYVGWDIWDFTVKSGILKKHADKYGITIEFRKMDYGPSLDAFVSGQVDACVMTNMEALDMPAAAGVTTTVVINGDYSNGNDGLATKGLDFTTLKGQQVALVENTVSSYLLWRILDKNGMKESDVRVLNVSDRDIQSRFETTAGLKAVVTWNPMLMAVKKLKGTNELGNSSQIPGEIQDLLVINSKVLADNPDLANALVGAWYETMAILERGDEQAMSIMATENGYDVAEFKAMLKTTRMYYSPKEAAEQMASQQNVTTMNYVRDFCFSHSLLGNATNKDHVGIEFPGGTVLGNASNVQLIYDNSYTLDAANGKLK